MSLVGLFKGHQRAECWSRRNRSGVSPVAATVTAMMRGMFGYGSSFFSFSPTTSLLLVHCSNHRLSQWQLRRETGTNGLAVAYP